MELSINTRQVYSEIDEFLGLLSDEQRNKVPKKVRELFNQEKDNDYKKGIDATVPIKKQNLKEETLAIIALLNLQYWCEDENEKQRLKEVYNKNEQIYQKILREKYNPDDIFMKRVKRDQVENKEMVEYKESIIKRFFSVLLRFLHLK